MEGASLQLNASHLLGAQSETPICRRSGSRRRQRGLRSVKSGGKVELNGQRPKPAKEVKVGDEMRIRVGPFVHAITVRALSDRRGPAALAAQLFEESADSIAARARLREQHRLAPSVQYDEGGRPTKKDRRALSAFEERQRRRR